MLDRFYRFKELNEQGGEDALMDLSRKTPVLKTHVPEHLACAVIELTFVTPALGHKGASWQLAQKGIMVSSSGVRSIWLRTDLEPRTKRLRALEARAVPGGMLQTEHQITAPQKAKQKKQAHGENERHHSAKYCAAKTLL